MAAENKEGGVIGSIYKSTRTFALVLGNIDSVNRTLMWVTRQLFSVENFFTLYFHKQTPFSSDIHGNQCDRVIQVSA